MKEEIKQIAKHYGVHHQLVKLMEELGELIVVAAKAKNSCVKDINPLITEIADVEIMLAQIKGLLGIFEKVEIEKEFKVARQLRRIAEEKMANELITGNYEREKNENN